MKAVEDDNEKLVFCFIDFNMRQVISNNLIKDIIYKAFSSSKPEMLKEIIKRYHVNLKSNDINDIAVKSCNSLEIKFVEYLFLESPIKDKIDLMNNKQVILNSACQNHNFDVIKFLLTNEKIKENADLQLNGS